jgi:hypothetical protein
MVGQRPPLPRSGSTLSDGLGLLFRCSLNLIGFQLFELEFQLLDLPLDLLGPNCIRRNFAINSFKCSI